MQKQISGKTFTALLNYYIDCLEHEDLLSVTFDIRYDGTKFFSNLVHQEELFHSNKQQITIEQSEETERFFQASSLLNKNNVLFYGYPIIVDPTGTVSPLFFIELHYEKKDDIIIFTATSPKPTLNHYLLAQQEFHPEEIRNIRRDLEENEHFTSVLTSLLNILHLKIHNFSLVLEKKTLTVASTPRVINKAILYFGQRTDITHNLIVELNQLKNKPFDDIASSSLLLFLTNEPFLLKNVSKEKLLLEVFPMNASQETAVSSALTAPLTVITGPPGTGKSQVVLNILANAIYQNKTVLFASKNNKAVDVVIEKFNTLEPQKIIVRMGHQAHRRNAKIELEKHFEQQQPKKICTVPQTIFQEISQLAHDIALVRDQLIILSRLTKSIDHAQQEIDSLLKQLPKDFSAIWNHQDFPLIDRCRLQNDIVRLFENNGVFHAFLQKLFPHYYIQKKHRCFTLYLETLPFVIRIYLEKTVNIHPDAMKNVLHWLLICKTIELNEEEIRKIKTKLATYPSFSYLTKQERELQQKKIHLSRLLFQQQMEKKRAQVTDDEKANVSQYFSVSEQLQSWVGDQHRFRTLLSSQVRSFQKIQPFLPAWVVTNLSAKHSFPLKNNLFDLLIIDEASQCDITSALPLLYRAKHVAVIGDPHQLKHISLLKESEDRDLSSAHQIEQLFTDFSFTKLSLYDMMEKVYLASDNHPILLNEHYRSHRDIISFSNEYYYEKKLTIATDESRLLPDVIIKRRVVWHHVQGKTERSSSPYNTKEALGIVEQIVQLLDCFQHCSCQNVSIGVVTLFRAQAELITAKLATIDRLKDMNITVGTAHRFQGDEKDVIFFSPAVSEGAKEGTLHWIRTTTQLLNVAITRARSLLVIVGDRHACAATLGPLADLVAYINNKEREYEYQNK